MESRPLSDGNRLQRAYARWAAPHYARMAPELREQAELLDRFLYSRRGLGVWLGLAGAAAGTAAGLRHAGLALGLALPIAGFVWLVMPVLVLGAWLAPGKFSIAQVRRRLPGVALLALAGGLLGFVVGHVAKRGALDVAQLADDLWQRLSLLVPATLAAAIAMLSLTWGVALVRQQLLERDASARRAAESRLKLLQAQIQPHFIFNTLAALQHWVDEGDPRAPALLRTLTAFLRGSTELLGRDTVTLADEFAAVEQYLQIMRARLGERLAYTLELDPACAARALPPGLLLTLVENAVEHGITPALQGGRVQVEARCSDTGTTVRVKDDGAGLAPQWRDGTGLANCRERLRHHGNGRGTLNMSPQSPGTLAELQLPEAA